jgi:hypothetical protein
MMNILYVPLHLHIRDDFTSRNTMWFQSPQLNKKTGGNS